ncbi:nucleotide exchange factor GrpE [Alkalihalobacillus sp. AL-G]|uniref:nucleotide exchange factor GrpE n=1 Tax=Alkalihalobacillus sp. AL-G TaxID=2926399 RepID=UPI00272D44D0|nr:nucleotide exchange factor GrpE [Alkalihalobacillus sp. AL-G]WLD92137.1 nucleotide exchange factor GrpE [Alkalihalobacillus sp. AL-G]
MEEKNQQAEAVNEEAVDTTNEDIIDSEESQNNDQLKEDQKTAEKDPVSELEQELEEIKNRMLRTQADYDNFRRRTREEKEAAAKYKALGMVEGLLPVIDNFERAMNLQTDEEQAKSLLQGVQMVYNQLIDALQKEGVEEINAKGEVFDPHLHQAVMQVQSEEYENNTVVEVLQKGYMLKDRVIRPAMVKVNTK